METRANYVAVGTFVILIAIGFVVAVLWVARGQFNNHGTRYEIYFGSVGVGLVEGSPARVSGVQVGRVVSVALDADDSSRVRVTIEVREDAPIRSDSVASVEIQGITGGSAIEITPGSKDAPPIEIKPDQRYAVIWSRESGMQQVVNSVPELINRVAELTEQLTKMVNDQNQVAVTQTLANLSQFTGALAAHSDDVGKILAEGATDAKQLQQLLDSLQQASNQLKQAGADAGTTFKSLNGLVNENREPLKQFTQTGLVEFQQLMTDMRSLVARLGRTVDGLDRDPSRLLYGDQRQGYSPK